MSTKIITVEGDNRTTINFMVEAALMSAKENAYIHYLANRLKRLPKDEQLPALYRFVRSIYKFVPDVTEQTVRTAKALMEDEVGNCVDASVYTSSVLIIMGIPHEFWYFAESEDSGYNHVFVVVENSITLDTILGKPNSGTERWFENTDEGYFNTQIPEYYDIFKVPILT